MKPVPLYQHPSEAPSKVEGVAATITRPAADRIAIRYVIQDPEEAIAVPDGEGTRRDGLWMTTCFEFFLGRASGDDYREFNFSPGTDWAAYQFDRPRQGMRQLLMPGDPSVSWRRDGDVWVLDATLFLNDLPENGSCNLTAVIEEKDGTKSHWAALHAPDRPDFHDRHCFAVAFPSLVAP